MDMSRDNLTIETVKESWSCLSICRRLSFLCRHLCWVALQTGIGHHVLWKDFFVYERATVSLQPTWCSLQRQCALRLCPCASALLSIHVGLWASFLMASSEAFITKYADDILIAFPVWNMNTRDESILCEEGNLRVFNWCSSHGLILNSKKTERQWICKPRANLNLFDSVFSFSKELKLLRHIFNERFDWDRHIWNTCKAACRRIYALRRFKCLGVSKKELVNIFNTFVRSLLEHNFPVFVGINKKLSSRLIKLCKLCHRIISGIDCVNSCLGNLEDNRRRVRSFKVFE